MKITCENQKIRVFREPKKRAHSTNRLRGLPQVFNARKMPWIDIDAADAAEIKKCIDTCPSGALSYELIDEKDSSKKITKSQIKPLTKKFKKEFPPPKIVTALN